MAKITAKIKVGNGDYHDLDSPEAKKAIEGTVKVAIKGTNTSKLITGFIDELTRVEDELDRVSKPHKEHRKDILQAAKDNGLKVASLKKAVKFKRAEEQKRAAMKEEEKTTEIYLSFIQLSLFS